MNRPWAIVYAANGRLIATPAGRTRDGERFMAAPLEPLAGEAGDEELGRLALAALDAYVEAADVAGDHDAALYRAGGVRTRSAFFAGSRAAEIAVAAEGGITVAPMENLGGGQGFTWTDDDPQPVAGRDPATVGAALRRALDAQRGSDLRRDLERAAEWIAEALTEDGYLADFTRKSAREVDRFYDESLEAPGRPAGGSRLAEDTGRRLFALGAYVGAILEREAGGRWRPGEADGEEVPMDLADGSTVWPIARAIDRFELGAEAGIAAYVASLAPEPESRGLRRLLGR